VFGNRDLFLEQQKNISLLEENLVSYSKEIIYVSENFHTVENYIENLEYLEKIIVVYKNCESNIVSYDTVKKKSFNTVCVLTGDIIKVMHSKGYVISSIIDHKLTKEILQNDEIIICDTGSVDSFIIVCTDIEFLINNESLLQQEITQLLQNNRVDEALFLLNNISTKFSSALYDNFRGLAYFYQQNYKVAESLFKKTLLKEPKNIDYMLNFIMSIIKGGNIMGAKHLLKKYIHQTGDERLVQLQQQVNAL